MSSSTFFTAVLASLQQLIYFQSSGPLCPWRGDWIEQLQMSTSGSTKTEWKTKNHPNEVFKVNFYCNILFIMTVLQNMKICWIGDAWYIHQIWSISTFYLINQGGVFIFLQSNIIFIPSWASEHVAHFLRFFQHLYILQGSKNFKTSIHHINFPWPLMASPPGGMLDIIESLMTRGKNLFLKYFLDLGTYFLTA